MLASDFIKKYEITAKPVRLLKYTVADTQVYKFALLYSYTDATGDDRVLMVDGDNGEMDSMSPDDMAEALTSVVRVAHQGSYAFDEWVLEYQDESTDEPIPAYQQWTACVWLRHRLDEWIPLDDATMRSDLTSLGKD